MYGFLIRLNPLKARFSRSSPRRTEAFTMESPPRRVIPGAGLRDRAPAAAPRSGDLGLIPARAFQGGDSSESSPQRALRSRLDPGLLTGCSQGGPSSEGPPRVSLSGCLPRGPLFGESFEGSILWDHSPRSGSSEQDLKEGSTSGLPGPCSPGHLPWLRLLGATASGDAHPEDLPCHLLLGEIDKG
jgi:hypothetical protein